MDASNMGRSGNRLSSALTRRTALAALAGGMGAIAWGDTGLTRKKHRARKPHSRVGTEAKGGVTQRPISDFLSQQGSTSVFVPPAPDVIAWAVAPTQGIQPFAWVDYTANADADLDLGLGTTASGKVLEWREADGRAKVQVNLHTRNALAWMIEIDVTCVPTPPGTDFTCVFNKIANNTPVFGYRAQDVDDDHPAALADSTLDVVFLNTAPGAPLPDLVTAINGGVNTPPIPPPGFELLSLKFNARADGLITDPEIRPGRLTVVQTAPRLDKCITGDCFPAEQVRVQPVGH